ncbi:MAG TPA: hypothetical protein VEH04_06285 [Verrucomicrobiae bacterium]|nr:hypothetical protein [Verrucomicrobiae bacterium]
MKFLATVIIALTLTTVARAQVVIYRQAYTETLTGLGATKTTQYNGYCILDQQGTFRQLDIVPKRKRFTIWSYDTFWVDYLQAGGGREQMCLTVPFSDIGGVYFKGNAVNVNVGTQYMFIAKTLNITGNWISGEGADALFASYRGTLTFDAKATAAANKAGRDVLSAMDVLTAGLTARGFIEEL